MGSKMIPFEQEMEFRKQEMELLYPTSRPLIKKLILLNVSHSNQGVHN